MSVTRKKISFEKWIDEIGVDTLAARLRVLPCTVQLWRRSKCDPRVDQMRRIKRMTRGRIDYDAIIDRPILTKKFLQNKG